MDWIQVSRQAESSRKETDVTLTQYVENTRSALFFNPPRNQPAYQGDPIAMWRYYMRNFGAGLGVYDEKQVRSIVSGLYSSWFVRLEFNSRMPNIDAKTFFSWIYGAMNEMKAKHGHTPRI